MVDGEKYAYTCLNLEKQNVQIISEVLRIHKHLRQINLSFNDLREIEEVVFMEYLVNF